MDYAACTTRRRFEQIDMPMPQVLKEVVEATRVDRFVRLMVALLP